jgi:hypothetical protein
MGGIEVSRDLGVDEPSRPESSMIVSESESLPKSEVSIVETAMGARRGVLLGEDWRGGEFMGERMR